MGILSKIMGWDATQQYLDRMQETGHQAKQQDSTEWPSIAGCRNCAASVDPDDEYCGQCGTRLWVIEIESEA